MINRMWQYIKYLFRVYVLRRKWLVNPKTGELDLQYKTKKLKQDFFLYQRRSDDEPTSDELAERFKAPPKK
tara:strand:- start:25593 stop:25805 length:213 start_codon:yes stop_codon:yes gene_type:complete